MSRKIFLARFPWFAVGILSAVVLALLLGARGPRPGDASAAAALQAPAPAESNDDGKVRILCLGAHPDDCELKAAGVAALWAAQGHHVKFVSVTNGDVGHWKMAGGPLARRRTAEVQRCAKILGITSEVLDIHDGELLPTLENRNTLVRLIRRWKADIVMGHRPNDYHPDHRNVGLLMQDAAYMVTVPHYCSDTPHLAKNPVFLFFEDGFQKPNPFAADIAVGIDEVIGKKMRCVEALESQFYEGGCCTGMTALPRTPEAIAARKKVVHNAFDKRFAASAARHRAALARWYGKEKAAGFRYAEAFEVCEYGRRPSDEEVRKLFAFLPAR